MSTTAITEETVKRLARLARLSVDAYDRPKLAQDLARILEHVASLDRVDTTGVEPTSHVSVSVLPVRDDEPAGSLDHDLALSQAPRTAEGAFAVPAFVEE